MASHIWRPVAVGLVSLNASYFGIQYYYNRPLSPRGDSNLAEDKSSWAAIAKSDPLRRFRDSRLTNHNVTIKDLLIQCEEQTTRGPLYQLLDSPGKGRGLFATTTISPGSTILEEKTILACGNEGASGGWKFGARDLQNFAGQLITLSPHLQSELFKLEGKQLLEPPLMSHYGRILNEHVYHADGGQLSWRESLRLQDALRIFYTNAATLYEPDATWSNLRPAKEEVGDGLFLTFSRINHSCEPNAVWDTGRNGGVMEVRAKSTIEPGEEITISYIGQIDKPVEERRKVLRRWGFECQCKKCGPLKGDEDSTST